MIWSVFRTEGVLLTGCSYYTISLVANLPDEKTKRAMMYVYINLIAVSWFHTESS